jgi:hypothetical protein
MNETVGQEMGLLRLGEAGGGGGGRHAVGATNSAFLFIKLRVRPKLLPERRNFGSSSLFLDSDSDSDILYTAWSSL